METYTRHLAYDASRLGVKTRPRVRHLVAELDDHFVHTACGKTWARSGLMRVVAEPVLSADCGLCRRIEEGR